MKNYQFIKKEHLNHGIVIITLNRPEKRNALCIDLMNEVTDAVKASEKQRVIIIQGEGSIFCSGLDLKRLMIPKKTHASAQAVADLFLAIHETPVTTIASIQGAAVAGGAGLALSCDLVIAEERTRLGFPEVQRGLVAALVIPIIRRLMPEHLAKELLLTGDLIDAEKALHLKLINKLAPSQNLFSETLKVADNILKGSPGAIASTKKLWNAINAPTFEKEIKTALALHRKMRSAPEALEGIQAFLEHRKPEWEP